MLAKIALTLAVIAGVWFLIRQAGKKGRQVVKSRKQDASAPTDVVDLEPCPKCGGYHEGGAGNCPSDRS